jgi:spore coat protein B
MFFLGNMLGSNERGRNRVEENYLQSLIGKGVQIHRGGPDSNTGKLLDVTDDYVALQKDDGEIIYFKTSHIKSIRENPMIKFNSLLNVDESLFIKASTFQEMASQLKEQNVRINGVGPESKVGKLIDIRDDFVIIFTEDDGLIFYKDQHIKSLSTPIETSESSNELGEKEEEPVEEQVVKEVVDTELENLLKLSEASNLNDVLTNLKYSWVKVNRKGPESVEGLLVDSNDQQLVLAVDNEILRISTYHVKNISVSSKKSKEESEKSEGNSSEKATEKNSKQDNSKQKDSSKEESNEQNSNEHGSENVSEAQRLFEERLAVVARKRNRRKRKNAIKNRGK